jgi:serpin B
MSRLSRRSFLTLSGAAAAGAALGRFATACPVLPPQPQLEDAAAWTGQFGTDLFARLRTEPGNLFISPFSIQTALAMTAAGARGITADEMFKTLRLWGDPHPAFGELIATVNRNAKVEKPAFELTTANAVWAGQQYPWQEDYLNLTRKHYGAGVIPTDFGQPEPARRRINGWVETETRQKIKELIAEGVIDTLTVMVLTNAIYFKSAWQTPFEKFNTRDQPFTRADGTKAPVPLMHQQETIPYLETDGLQVVELPYVKRELSMVVVLPRTADGLAKVEDGLSAEKLAGWAKAMNSTETRVFLPRFTVEWDKELVPVLKAMGMVTACEISADFSGMITKKMRIWISNVIHKAFVSVDEAGTEAAAATAVVMKRASAVQAPQPKEFRADRPFLFLIRDNKTKAILFLGRYAGPKG